VDRRSRSRVGQRQYRRRSYEESHAIVHQKRAMWSEGQGRGAPLWVPSLHAKCRQPGQRRGHGVYVCVRISSRGWGSRWQDVVVVGLRNNTKGFACFADRGILRLKAVKSAGRLHASRPTTRQPWHTSRGSPAHRVCKNSITPNRAKPLRNRTCKSWPLPRPWTLLLVATSRRCPGFKPTLAKHYCHTP
jgi:hypothetical protein